MTAVSDQELMELASDPPQKEETWGHLFDIPNRKGALAGSRPAPLHVRGVPCAQPPCRHQPLAVK